MSPQTALPEPEETEATYLLDFATDFKEFAIDIASCSIRIVVSWRIMLAMAVGEELAFSTALLLGGMPVFEKSTDWMKRTRKRIKKVLSNIY